MSKKLHISLIFSNLVVIYNIYLAARKDGTRPLKINQYGNRRINKNSRV